MDLVNLREDYLYDLIPHGVLNLDERGLLQAVLGGVQDRVEDLRAFGSQLSGAADPRFNPGATLNVVLLTLASTRGKVVTRVLNVTTATPTLDNYDTEAEYLAALRAWAVAEAQVEDSQVEDVALGTDALRLVSTDLIQYLAATVGAVLYKTNSLDAEEIRLGRQRALESHFPRLKVKGAGQSFDALGRLLNFTDVVYTPLWGRLSPRLPRDVGDPANDPDFLAVPDVWPRQELGDVYDPRVTDDGPFFGWESAPDLTTNPASPLYYPASVNQDQPFFTVEIEGSGSVIHPSAGIYALEGGGYHTRAAVEVVPRTDFVAGISFRALGEGAGFNGLEIEIPAQGSLRIGEFSLSALKYRTSYFDLGLLTDLDRLRGRYPDRVVAASPDLEANPSLAPDGTAVPPYRPWVGGVSVSGTVVEARTQATSEDTQISLEAQREAGREALQYVEEVRAATRRPRLVRFGVSLRDQVGYAAFPAQSVLAVSDGTQTSFTGFAVGQPLEPYNATLAIETAGSIVVATGEQDLVIGTLVHFRLPGFTGSYDLADDSYMVELSAPQDGQRLLSLWSPTDTEVVRPEPQATMTEVETEVYLVDEFGNYLIDESGNFLTASGSPELVVSGTEVGYQARAEDEPDLAGIYDQAICVPWRRGLVGGGEDVDLDIYLPGEVPDLGIHLATGPLVVIGDDGVEHEVVVYDLARTSTAPLPRHRLRAREIGNPAAYQPGRTALAFSGTSLAHVGGVLGVLVADPVEFSARAMLDELAVWLPLNEHPDGPKTVTDRVSGQDLYLSGVRASDRRWDEDRGWYLQPQGGEAAVTLGYRPVTGDLSLAVWLKPGAAGGSDAIVLELGSSRVLSGTIRPGQAYLVAGAGGTVAYNGTVYSPGESFVGVEGAVTFRVAGAAEVYQAGELALAPLLSAVLAGTDTGSQVDLTWRVRSAGSLSDVATISLETGVFNLCYLTRVGDTFEAGVGQLDSALSAAFTGSVIADEPGQLETWLAVRAGQRAVGYHDLRLWSVGLSVAELERVRTYTPTPTAVATAPPYAETTALGERWMLSARSSGFVYPAAVQPVGLPATVILAGSGTLSAVLEIPVDTGVTLTQGSDVSTEAGGVFPAVGQLSWGIVDHASGSLAVVTAGTDPVYVDYHQVVEAFDTSREARVVRYDAQGRYVGPELFREVGLGGGQALPDTWKLGTRFHEVQASGTVVEATGHGYHGLNQSFLEVSAGTMVRVTPPYGALGGVTTLEATGTASPWPAYQEVANPGRRTIWATGDDGQLYAVSLRDAGAGVELHAALLARRRTAAELDLTGLSAESETRVGLEVAELLAGPSVEVSTGTNSLSVRSVLGARVETAGATLDTTDTTEVPEAPGYHGELQLLLATSAPIASRDVVITVHQDLEGLATGVYLGELTTGPARRASLYEATVRLAGLDPARYEADSRAVVADAVADPNLVVVGLASTGSVAIASFDLAVDTLDGSVTLDPLVPRVLLKDQDDPAENGIYDLAQPGLRTISDRHASATALLEAGELRAFVAAGATQAGQTFELDATPPVVLGTTELAFNAVDPVAPWALFEVEHQVYAQASGTVADRPLAHLYLDRETVVHRAGAEVYASWDDPDLSAPAQTYADRAGAGRLGFTHAGSLVAGYYAMTIDAGNLGRVDPAFDGFEVVLDVGGVPIATGVLVEGGTGLNPRAATVLEFELSTEVPASWTFGLDWTNDRDLPDRGLGRHLAVFSYQLERYVSRLYQVSVSATGEVVVDRVTVAGQAPPATPGGWLLALTAQGTVAHASHEAEVRPSQGGVTSRVALADLLTATTHERREDVLMVEAGTALVIEDAGTVAAPAILSVVITP